MLKFALILIKDNEQTVINTFENKDEAIENGKSYYENECSGKDTLACILADFDENNQRTDRKCRIYKVW